MRSTSASDLDLIEARGDGGGGVLPIMTCTGRLRPKGVSFSGFRSVWKGIGVSAELFVLFTFVKYWSKDMKTDFFLAS